MGREHHLDTCSPDVSFRKVVGGGQEIVLQYYTDKLCCFEQL